MKVSEIFKSIQGEGKYTGWPVLFIRVSGCNENCSWCDSKYAKDGKEMTVKQIVDVIKKSKKNIVVWTGGEPLLYYNQIALVKSKLEEVNCNRSFHLESNGKLFEREMFFVFDYCSLSPKNIKDAKNVQSQLAYVGKEYFDIKVVTNLKTIGKELIKYATMLMPFSTFNQKTDKKTKVAVWNYCCHHDLKYAGRIHIDVFGKKRGI